MKINRNLLVHTLFFCTALIPHIATAMEAIIIMPPPYKYEILALAYKPATKPLHQATQSLLYAHYRQLSQAETVNAPDEHGRLPLHFAAYFCDKGKGNKLRKLHIRIFTDTIMKTRNLNQQDVMGYTALHYAVASNRHSNVTDLIAAKADPNIPSHNGDTPLHCAVLQIYPEMVYTLIIGGASIKICNRDGKSPVDLAKDALPKSAAGGERVKNLIKIIKCFKRIETGVKIHSES